MARGPVREWWISTRQRHRGDWSQKPPRRGAALCGVSGCRREWAAELQRPDGSRAFVCEEHAAGIVTGQAVPADSPAPGRDGYPGYAATHTARRHPVPLACPEGNGRGIRWLRPIGGGMELRTGFGEGARSEITTDPADRGLVARLQQLVGKLIGSAAAAQPIAGRDADIELEAG